MTARAVAAGVLLLASCTRVAPHEMYARGEHAAAARAYARALAQAPGDPVAHYNLGATLLRLSRYEGARPHLEAAARRARTEVRQKAYYNLGNSYLEPVFAGRGEAARRDMLGRAIVAYKRALLLGPGDADAKWNLELARRLLEHEPRSPTPRQNPQRGGGGGGGGGGGDSETGRRDPRPQPRDAGGQAPLSREAAARLLSRAQQTEVSVQREKLRKAQPPASTAHE